MSQITVTDIIALVFDFDDTLVPDSTTKLLRSRGIDTKEFWQVHAKKLIQEGYDPPSAYLKLLLDNVGEDKPLGALTNDDLRRFGETLDADYYPGLPQFFDEVVSDVREKFKNIEVEFYIISGGLQPILEGSKIVRKYFSGVYGCQLAGDSEQGMLKYVRRSVTFTEKTRYLFEINKGIKPEESKNNPFLVNKHVESKDRRVPFRNIIYVGDGLTDIPCFSLLQSLKGKAFGVFNPENPEKAKVALEEFLIPKRVVSMHAPKFGCKDDLGALLRAAVANRCLEIGLERRTAY
jgi:hypothetical protein